MLMSSKQRFSDGGLNETEAKLCIGTVFRGSLCAMWNNSAREPSLNDVSSIPTLGTTISQLLCGLYAVPVPEHQHENNKYVKSH